jgi:hypothetical protein
MNDTEPSRFSRRPATLGLRLLLALSLLVGAFSTLGPPEPVQANDAEFAESLARINTYRAWIGIPPLEMHPALMAAAQSHADYWLRNSGSMPGLHNQTPGAPGFSGATMSERASNFGYSGSINENIGLSGSMLSTVDWSIATINHRLTLIDPRYRHIGFGAVRSGNGGMETIKLGAPNWSNTAEPAWQSWPVDGTTNVGLTYLGSAPSPFSNVPYPVGYPITLKYHGSGSVSFSSATLRATGSQVSILAETGHGWLTRNTMMILATNPLQPHTTYQVTVQGTANGQAFTRAWTFETGANNAARPQRIGGSSPAPPPPPDNSEPELTPPERLAEANGAFQQTWMSADAPVKHDLANRTWLWGPDTFSTRVESYAESPGGQREVAYFDKSRMEINDPSGDVTSQWYVTNGLLVRDMIRGAVQVGDHQFETLEPAQIAIAGDDLASNPHAPTYASLWEHSAMNHGRREPDRTGEAVMTHLTARGTVHHGPETPEGVFYGRYDDVTGYNVADIFWDWIAGADHFDWIYAVGHPITNPHWVYTRVNGQEQWVLVQAFQRRLLTYTPGNDPAWRLEMGNAGRHYFTWRYGEPPPH